MAKIQYEPGDCVMVKDSIAAGVAAATMVALVSKEGKKWKATALEDCWGMEDWMLEDGLIDDPSLMDDVPAGGTVYVEEKHIKGMAW